MTSASDCKLAVPKFCSVCSESKPNLACSLFHLQGEQLAIHLQESLSSSSIRPADCISRASRSTAHHSTLSSLQHRHMHIWLHDLEIGRVDCRLSSHSQSALHRKATSVVFAFAKCPPPKGDFGFLTRGLHVVKSSLTDSGIFRSSGMYSVNGLRCPERPLEVLAVLKHVGAVETELRRPLALLLLRFVVRVVVLLLLGPLLSTILRQLELLHAVLEPHFLSSHHRRWIRWQNAFCGVARPRPPVRRLNGTRDGRGLY